MRGKKEKATNWILVGLLLLGWQYLLVSYIIPADIIQGNNIVLGLSSLLALVLAWITAKLVRSVFFNAGMSSGRISL